MRIQHSKYGVGITLCDPFITDGGRQAVRVAFDARPNEERIMLISCLKTSKSSLPAVAKSALKKKRTKKVKAEPVSDELPDTEDV